MSNQAEKQKILIKEWIKFARIDLKTAKACFRDKIYATCCFHSQQAVEKILEAYLLQKNDTVPKIHDLTQLAKKTQLQIITQDYTEKIDYLDQFYIPIRYPDTLPGSLPQGLPTKSHATNAFKYAKEIFKDLHKVIKEHL